MSVYIDKKYISLLAPRMKQFKQRGEFLWNFRCPVCGDSKKSKTKSRGWIFLKGAKFRFYCHNFNLSVIKFIFLFLVIMIEISFKSINIFLLMPPVRDKHGTGYSRNSAHIYPIAKPETAPHFLLFYPECFLFVSLHIFRLIHQFRIWATKISLLRPRACHNYCWHYAISEIKW